MVFAHMGPKRGDSGPQSIYFSAPEQVIVLRSVQHMLRLVAYATTEHRREGERERETDGDKDNVLPFSSSSSCFELHVLWPRMH
jgi:hypothetical protein